MPSECLSRKSWAGKVGQEALNQLHTPKAKERPLSVLGSVNLNPPRPAPAPPTLCKAWPIPFAAECFPEAQEYTGHYCSKVKYYYGSFPFSVITARREWVPVCCSKILGQKTETGIRQEELKVQLAFSTRGSRI